MSNQTNNSERRNEQKLEPFSQLAKMNATFLKSDVHINEKKKWENEKPYYRIRKKKNSKDIMELCIVECLYIKEYLQYE